MHAWFSKKQLHPAPSALTWHRLFNTGKQFHRAEAVRRYSHDLYQEGQHSSSQANKKFGDFWQGEEIRLEESKLWLPIQHQWKELVSGVFAFAVGVEKAPGRSSSESFIAVSRSSHSHTRQPGSIFSNTHTSALLPLPSESFRARRETEELGDLLRYTAAHLFTSDRGRKAANFSKAIMHMTVTLPQRQSLWRTLSNIPLKASAESPLSPLCVCLWHEC